MLHESCPRLTFGLCEAISQILTDLLRELLFPNRSLSLKFTLGIAYTDEWFWNKSSLGNFSIGFRNSCLHLGTNIVVWCIDMTLYSLCSVLCAFEDLLVEKLRTFCPHTVESMLVLATPIINVDVLLFRGCIGTGVYLSGSLPWVLCCERTRLIS